MPKLTCFNIVRTIYEQLAQFKLPELEADLIIQKLSVATSSNSVPYPDCRQPDSDTYNFLSISFQNRAVILSLLWAIYSLEDNPNTSLLSIISGAIDRSRTESVRIFSVFQTTVNKIVEERKQQPVQPPVRQPEDNLPQPPLTAQYAIAPKRKTDVIKIFYFMLKLGLFTQTDGKPVQKEKDFMQAVGHFFGENFAQYAQFNAKAKNADSYMNIFQDLLQTAKDDTIIKQIQDYASQYVLN